MKKHVLFIFILILSVIMLSNSIAAGFKDDYDAIEEATKSVLKMYVYKNIDDDVLDYASTGSGFVAFNNSTMITNYHVIDDAAMVVAMDDDDNVYEIDKVLCADQKADIAILKFTVPSSLKPLELYPDNQLKRGAPVVAIGSPKGLKNTVSTGIVSYAYEDGIPEIQITAPISPGSSGGALFNDNGKVIGVTSAGYQSKDEYGKNTDAQNINFAVNIAVAQAMYNAWDGSTYSFTSFPSTAKMDFTDVYKHESDETTLPSDQPVIIEAESSGTWICTNCGAENTTKFCEECGAEKTVWICSCGKINSSNKFCGECGKSYAELIAAFDEAVEKAKQLDYEGAVETLEDLGSFNSGSFETAAGTHADAQSYVGKTYYDQGLYLQENGGDHDAILKSFEKAGSYGDAQEQIAGENARFAKLNYDAGIEQLNNGEYLSAVESFKAAGEFQDAAEKILEVYYAWGQNLLENKNYEESREKFILAGEFQDAVKKILEVYYAWGQNLLENKNYEESREKFILAGEYENASDMVYGTYYAEAEEYLNNLDYENALNLLKKADEYLDAKEKLYDTSMVIIRKLIESGSYKAAIEFYEKEFIPYGITADIVLANVNDKSDVVSEVLNLVKALHPNSEKIPKKEDTYKESYEPLVIKAKEYFGMNNDGKISLEEYYKIHSMIYLGSEGTRVRSLLEKIFDLGYFQNLPDPHSTYENRYINGIKKIEKKLKCKEDGIITKEEYDLIMAQDVIAPNPPKRLTTNVNNGTITISWSKVDGAVSYEVRIGGIERTTDSTEWVEKLTKTDRLITIKVASKKYTETGSYVEKTFYVPKSK